MITLYTAVGRYLLRSDKNGLKYPVIIKNKKELHLDRHEMLLWNCLAWNILTYEELRTKFYEKEREYHLLSDVSFDQYLKRLVFRGLITSGSDYVGIDALYNLVGHLYILPAKGNWLLNTASFLKLVFKEHLPFKIACHVFNRQSFNPQEKQILHLTKQQVLSTAELIACLDGHHLDIKNHDALMSCLYNTEETDCDNIATVSRFLGIQPELLVTLANLYLRRLILFDTM